MGLFVSEIAGQARYEGFRAYEEFRAKDCCLCKNPHGGLRSAISYILGISLS